MRILLLSHYWAPEVGAPQRRWNRLAEALISRGHELAVLAPAPHYPGGRLLQGGGAHMAGSIRRDVTGAMVHRTIFRPYSSGVCGRGVDQMVAAADSVRLGVERFRGANRPDIQQRSPSAGCCIARSWWSCETPGRICFCQPHSGPRPSAVHRPPRRPAKPGGWTSSAGAHAVFYHPSSPAWSRRPRLW